MNQPQMAPSNSPEKPGSRVWGWMRDIVEHPLVYGAIFLIGVGEWGLGYANERWLHLAQIPFLIAVSVVVFVFVSCFALIFNAITYVARKVGVPDGTRLSKLLALAAVVSAVGLTVAFAATDLVNPFSKEHLVLMGSANVRSTIFKRPHVKDALWLDVGSGSGQRVLFQAFDYGGRTGKDTKRFGLVGVSSDGVNQLVRMYRNPLQQSNGGQKTDQGNKEKDFSSRQLDNYWLNLKLPQVPLALLFRDNNLKPGVVERDPEEMNATDTTGPYHILLFSELQNYIRNLDKQTMLFVPEADSGTSALIAKGEKKGGKIEWPSNAPKFYHYEEYIEGFQDHQFAEFVSAVPLSRPDDPAPATCEELGNTGRGKLPIHSAAICQEEADGKCRKLLWAQFSVLIKVVRVSDQNYQFEITNKAECDLAKSLLETNDIEEHRGKCIVKNSEPYVDPDDPKHPIDHIATLLTADAKAHPRLISGYLKCQY